MRHKLLIVLAILLCSCSAARRLAHLLKQHPELRIETASVVVPVEVCLPGDSASMIIPPQEAYVILSSDTTTIQQVPSYTVKAGRAQAILERSDSGVVLKAIQLPDTVSVEASADVPIVEVRDLPMQESSAQIFFRVLGYIFGGFIVFFIIIFTLKKFLL